MPSALLKAKDAASVRSDSTVAAASLTGITELAGRVPKNFALRL